MTTIIIGESVSHDNFITLEVNENAFRRIFNLLSRLFEVELTQADFLKFKGVAQGLDTIDLTDLLKETFNKTVDLLKDEFIDLGKLMQADPRFEIEMA